MSSSVFPGRHRLLLGAATAVAAGAISFAAVANASSSVDTVATSVTADGVQVAHVKTAFTAAIEADRLIDAPAAATDYSKAANQALTAGKLAPAPDAATRQQQLSSGLSVLAKYFTPAQAQHEAIGLRTAVGNEAGPGFRNIGSGASNVAFTQVAVAGTTATVQAAVTTWAKFQQQQADGTWVTASPVNVMDYTATLVQNAQGQWVVSSLKGDFAPGEGP